MKRRKGYRRRNKARRIAFILIPLFLALSVVVLITLKTILPGKKSSRQSIRGLIAAEKNSQKPGQRSSPKLALIIDDGGYNMDNLKEMLGTGKRITFAILPHAPHAQEAALLARGAGSEVMLHLPMEPHDGEQYALEKDTVRTGMEPRQVRRLLEEALRRVPHVRGVNNHMGSKATQDPRVMGALMSVLQKEGLFFIDSNTNSQTLGPEMARKAGVPYKRNDQFIDHQKEIRAIKDAVRLAMSKAKQEGKALAIGHPQPMTAQAVKEMIAEIKKEGVRLVFASEVVE